MIVGAEIDEGADRPRARRRSRGDRQLVEPVLQRDDIAVGGQDGRQTLPAAARRVLRLDAEQHVLERTPAARPGVTALALTRNSGDRPGDGEALAR